MRARYCVTVALAQYPCLGVSHPGKSFFVVRYKRTTKGYILLSLKLLLFLFVGSPGNTDSCGWKNNCQHQSYPRSNLGHFGGKYGAN